MARIFLAGAAGVIGDRLVPMLRAAGAKKLIAQSIAFIYAPEGPMVQTEEGRLPSPKGPPPFGPGSAAMQALERSLDWKPRHPSWRQGFAEALG